MRRLITTAGATALAVLALTACGGGGDAAAPEGAFVGKVEGSDAYVAVVSNGDEVIGYVCDGRKVSTWLDRSDVEDDEADLVNRDGDRIGDVKLASDGASGTVEIDGKEFAFSADPAEGEAGLYREAKGEVGEPGSRETGWIVLADGSVKGSTNFIDQEGNFATGTAPKRTSTATQVSPGFMDQEGDL